MTADESYSEYKMALFALAGVSYEEYTGSQLAAKVLDRLLLGCGEAGPSVRLQAPRSLEVAIKKAIAFDNEKTRTEKMTIFALGGNYRSRGSYNNNIKGRRPFNGSCYKCGTHGHKSNECRIPKPNESSNSSNPQQPQQPQQPPQQQQRPPPRCFVCNQEGHRAFSCPNRQGQGIGKQKTHDPPKRDKLLKTGNRSNFCSVWFKILINGEEKHCIIDTGASNHNVIPLEIANKIGLKPEFLGRTVTTIGDEKVPISQPIT